MPVLCFRILVVDDEEDILEALAWLLESEGACVICAHGVDEALGSMQRGFAPDAVITDLMMPGRPGEDLADELRGRSDSKDLPIVAMSASPLELWRIAGKVDACFEKPFSMQAMVDTLSRLCPASA